MLRARLLTLVGFAVAIVAAFAGPLAVHSAAPGASAQTNYTIFLPLVYGALSCSVPPTLTGPATNSQLKTLVPQFQWTPVADPTATFMTLQVALDTSFSAIVSEVSFDPSSSLWTDGATRLPGNLTPSTLYYWRLFVTCGNLQGPYSATWSLTTPPLDNSQFLPAPELVSPVSNAQVPPSAVTLTWTPVHTAIDYLVIWSPAGSNSFDFTYQKDNGQPSYQLVTIGPLAPNTTYLWTVQARNDYADGASQSPPGQFATTPAATSSTLSVRPMTAAHGTIAIGGSPTRPGAR